MALLGEYGAGKSTLMKILSGVYTRDSGSVKIFGEEVLKKYQLPVFFEDEKLTTKLVNSELSDMAHYKKSPKKIPDLKDAYSACMIIESYIQDYLRKKM